MKQYRTLPAVESINHGDRADPELIYKGKSFDYWDIENAFYNMAVDDIDNGEELSDSQFNEWLADNADRCYWYLDECGA